MKHPTIIKANLPYLNQLIDLEYLDIWRTGIILEDLAVLNQLKNLKEVHVSSAAKIVEGTFPELDTEEVLEQLIMREDIFPDCVFVVDFTRYD